MRCVSRHLHSLHPVQSRDKPALEQYLVEAEKYKLTAHDLFKQAVALKKRMEVRGRPRYCCPP